MSQPDPTVGDDTPRSPENWAHVRALVEEALTLPPDARPAFLNASCRDDGALRDRVGRLAAACERAGGSWAFLAQPAGELVAPLLVADATLIAGPAARSDGPSAAFRADLADRYAVGAEVGRGGMANVYVAEDLRHRRRVALKVLNPDVGAMLGAERFLAEIRVTAGLQHPNLLPLFDSGEAGGLLYYVMPLIEGATLRARLRREGQLPVDEAVRLAGAIAGALDYAHRQGVVHRDLKPENILLHDDQPLVADFGIARAVAKAADTHLTATGVSLGTPRYMSPEQAAGNAAVDGRSDIYSLACVLYELLTGDPPFTGSSVQAIIAKVLAERPSSVRTVRPTVPDHVDVALARALAKLPADRYATAREFADALVNAAAAGRTKSRAPTARWPRSTRSVLGAAAIIGLTVIAWMTTRAPAAPAEITQIPYRNLIDETQFGGVTITPDGRALVYTGSAEAGRPIMLWRLDQRAGRAIPGTEGEYAPFVSPDGRRLAVSSTGDGALSIVPIEGVASPDGAQAWRFGNGAWVNDSVLVTNGGRRGLLKRVPGADAPTQLTRPDTAHGETRHVAPLLLPRMNAVVFTVSKRVGQGLVVGRLAIASFDPGTSAVSPHVMLAVTARRAVAFVDGWLLYTSADGKAIMAARLDAEHAQITGAPISVLEDDGGNLETASLADNCTLLYLRRPRSNSAVLVDPGGGVRPGFTSPDGPFMHPRLSPDGKRFAVQVSSARGEDVWLYDIASR
ncbi:MAG: protein kinase domain-containing protein, partial [Gemmatimonadaceae bacterium]